jgi:hypothetical protein
MPNPAWRNSAQAMVVWTKKLGMIPSRLSIRQPSAIR